jgi:hypothetical protein
MRRGSNVVRFFWLVFVIFISIVARTAPSSDQTPTDHEQKPAAIQGLVTNGLTGEPVPHAHVILTDFPQRTKAKYGAITNPDGRFSISAIAPGKYRVTVERSGYLPVSGDRASESGIALKAGEQISDAVFKLIPACVISGRVLDQTDSPMQDVLVEAIGPALAKAETNDRGEFRISGLATGNYVVKASPQVEPLPPEIRTDGTLEVNYGPTFYPGSLSAKYAVPVTTQAGVESDRIDIKLKPTPIVRVSGTVSGIPREARDVWVEFDHSHGRSAHLDPAMKFTIWRLSPGHHELTAHYVDPIGKHMQSAPAEINVSNSNVDNLVLSLIQQVELTGQVRYEDTRNASDPKEKTTLRFKQLDALDGSDFDEEIQPDGTFKVTDVDPGRYYITVEGPPGGYVKSIEIGSKESQHATLDLRSGLPKTPIILKLGSDGGEISGVVLNHNGPVANATVALLSAANETCESLQTTDADSKGDYAFHGLTPGQYRLFAFDPKQIDGSRCDIRSLFEGVMHEIEVVEGDRISQDLHSPDEFVSEGNR